MTRTFSHLRPNMGFSEASRRSRPRQILEICFDLGPCLPAGICPDGRTSSGLREHSAPVVTPDTVHIVGRKAVCRGMPHMNLLVKGSHMDGACKWILLRAGGESCQNTYNHEKAGKQKMAPLVYFDPIPAMVACRSGRRRMVTDPDGNVASLMTAQPFSCRQTDAIQVCAPGIGWAH